MPHDLIYLNKRGHPSVFNAWVYYRITSAGNEGDHIELCLLSWPDLADRDEVVSEKLAVVTNPYDTGLARAYPNILNVLKKKWDIDHRDEDLIGIRERKA